MEEASLRGNTTQTHELLCNSLKKVYFAGQVTKDYYYLIHCLFLANTSRRIRNQAFLIARGEGAILLMGSGFPSKDHTLPQKSNGQEWGPLKTKGSYALDSDR